MMKSFIICLLLMFSMVTINAKDLIFGMGIPKEHPLFNKVQLFWNEIAVEIEEVDTITLIYMPLRRAKSELLKNTIDGDSGRTKMVYKDEANAFIVNTPILLMKYYVISKKNITINDPQSIKNYNLITETGNEIVIDFAKKHNFKLHYADSQIQSIRMIQSDRMDIYIASSLTSEILINDDFKNSGIKILKPALFDVGTHLFLSKKNKSLVNKFDAAIKKLIANGRVAEIFK